MFLFSHLLALAPAKSGSLQKIRSGVRGRKGWYEDLRAQLQPFSLQRPRVWIHAASMGECEQAKPLLRELGARFPETVRVLTIFSPSAYRHITRQNFPAEVICYLPFDTLRQAGKFYDLVHPVAGLIIRHDYWPNFIWQAKARGIFLLLANASVSANAKSFRHKPLVRQFNREVLSHFDVIAAVSSSAAESLLPLLRHPERLRILGDTRFEQVLHRVQNAAPHKILPPAWRSQEIHLVAGSTWPSDEDVIIPAFAAARRNHPELRMILVPHEPTEDHLQNAERLLQQHDLSSLRLSQARVEESANAIPQLSEEKRSADILSAGEMPALPHVTEASVEKRSADILSAGRMPALPHVTVALRANVLLVDRVGVLAELYGAGKIAFVGGSFGPGVHSVLEAAAHGVPVLFGPRHHNSAEALEMARINLGKPIVNEQECERTLQQLLMNEAARDEWGKRCRAYVEQKTGAARALVALLEPIIRLKSEAELHSKL